MVVNSKYPIPSITVNALYSQVKPPIYQGNPLIEALPPSEAKLDIYDKLKVYPTYDTKQRKYETFERLDCVQTLFHVFQPWGIHVTIAEKFSRAIKEGYVSRNPLQSGYASDLNKLYSAVKNKNGEFVNLNLTNANASGFSIIGYSGMGKTSAVDRVLSTYPQIITHSQYNNQSFPFLQIVWMKLVCPHDGSIKGLCSSFFSEFDRITGDNTYQKFALGRSATVDSMIPQISLIARRHALGALIIDEIQHLKAASSGGAEKMLNFIVNFVNIIGIPVILIGTPKALDVINGELMQARRNSGQQGAVIMDSLKRGSNDWNMLINGIWRYQWTRKMTPLTNELSDTLFDESYGIVDVAVKLYAMSQIKAIDEQGSEIITAKSIKTEAKSDDFALYREIFSALRKGNSSAIAQFDDLVPLTADDILSRYRADVSNKRLSNNKSYTQQSFDKNIRNTQLQEDIAIPKTNDVTKNVANCEDNMKNSGEIHFDSNTIVKPEDDY